MTARDHAASPSAGVLGLLLLLAGCQHAPAPNGDPPLPPDPIDYVVIRDAHNERVGRIPVVRSSGVIELRWRDERGDSHFEQGDIRLFLRHPDRLSLQVHKLGETFLWFGADEGSYWLFDLVNKDDRVLYVGRGDARSSERIDIPGAVHPLRLIDMLGLTPLPDDGRATYHVEQDAWVIETTGQGGPLRLYFDRVTLLPKRVEGMSGDAVECAGELRDYASLAVDGLPPGLFPRIPMRVRLSDGRYDGEATVALGEPTTRINERAYDNAFDIDRLAELFAPDRRVEH